MLLSKLPVEVLGPSTSGDCIWKGVIKLKCVMRVGPDSIQQVHSKKRARIVDTQKEGP